MNPSLLKTKWSQLPEKVIRRLQAEKLRQYVGHTVLPFSAHYKELFARERLTAESIRSLEDLERLPFTSKTDLLNTPENPQRAKDFVLIPDQQVLARRPSTILGALLHGRERMKQAFESEFRPVFMTSTTGRSADPIPFLYTQHDLANLASTGKRLFEICGAQSELRLLNLFPYAPHLAFWQTHYGATAFGVFCASTGGGKVMGTEGNLRLIQKIKPDVLIGMPTFIYHVLRLAAEEGVRCENLRQIVLGGEKVPDGMRRKLINLTAELGAKEISVLATYGFTEAKMAWAECPVRHDQIPDGYHLYPDAGIIEVIDPKTGQIVPTGHPGELVFTPLDARGSVVLRYRTGDFIDGGLVYDPCPHCGRCVPRLVGNIGRNSEVKEMKLDKLKGTLVDFNQLEHVLDDADQIGAWQLELRKKNDDPLELDELILHVQKLNGGDEAKLIHDLNNRFIARTEIHPNRIVFHDGDELSRLQGVGVQLKEQKIIDHRPSHGHRPASNSPPVENASTVQPHTALASEPGLQPKAELSGRS
ncbi:MAG: AMP-binding protein [Verrucomicrobia bacterium]|nr:AMP-binding protein [Verrucomicrobiota bacterium]